MDDKKLEQWMNDHPMLSNAVIPTLAIGVMMFIMFTCMSVIQFALS